jgi:hypothetical protein
MYNINVSILINLYNMCLFNVLKIIKRSIAHVVSNITNGLLNVICQFIG